VILNTYIQILPAFYYVGLPAVCFPDGLLFVTSPGFTDCVVALGSLVIAGRGGATGSTVLELERRIGLSVVPDVTAPVEIGTSGVDLLIESRVIELGPIKQSIQY
jgi:hypothetical protein